MAHDREDKYERQKEMARERQRKRRAKLSDEQLEAKRKYDRDRRDKLKRENKIKTVADMTPRERRKMQKYWRERNKERSLKNKALKNAIANTPPGTPTRSPERETEQKKRGRKNVRKSKAKAYRLIKKQEEQIANLKRMIEKYKKREYRQKVKLSNNVNTSPSPSKRVREIVGKDKVSPIVKRQLFWDLPLKNN